MIGLYVTLVLHF